MFITVTVSESWTSPLAFKNSLTYDCSSNLVLSFICFPCQREVMYHAWRWKSRSLLLLWCLINLTSIFQSWSIKCYGDAYSDDWFCLSMQYGNYLWVCLYRNRTAANFIVWTLLAGVKSQPINSIVLFDRQTDRQRQTRAALLVPRDLIRP